MSGQLGGNWPAKKPGNVSGRQDIAIAVLVTILVGVVVWRLGADSSAPGTSDVNSKPSVVRSSAAQALGITPRAEIAPSYEEIKRGLERIKKTPEHPNGPEVGPDGIIDKDVVKALSDYSDYFKGMKVVNWLGWYNGYTTLHEGAEYTISILMTAPQPNVMEYTDVLIYSTSPQQIEEIRSLRRSERVVLSGVFAGINSAAQVHLVDATIQPAE
jgi:hypothetical protein